LELSVLRDHFQTVGKRTGLAVVVIVAAVAPLRLAVKHLAKTKRRQVSKAATLGVLPNGSSARLKDGEYLADDDFQVLAGSLVGDFGWYLVQRTVVGAAWQCALGVVAVGVCKGLDSHCLGVVNALPEVGGQRSALTCCLMMGNIASSTVSRWIGLPKWAIPAGVLHTSSNLNEDTIAEFCSNCSPLHLLGWELLVPANSGTRLIRYVSVLGFAAVGAHLQLAYPFAHRGGAYNGSVVSILFR
jgi:hypothetical protein